MTVAKSTDDELAWAVVRYLALGPGSSPPIVLYVDSEDFAPRPGRWLTGRRETLDAFAERFPSQMDKPKRKRKT